MEKGWREVKREKVNENTRRKKEKKWRNKNGKETEERRPREPLRKPWPDPLRGCN